MTKSNHKDIFKRILVDFIQEEDPIYSMLHWVSDKILHSTKLGYGRGVNRKYRYTGQRKSIKIFGCTEIYSSKFRYHRNTVFNAKTYVERLWHFVRVSSTHNRYFESEEKLFESLTIIFKEMIRNPQLGYLAPFL
jgi:hypothetical protein